jgi:hypothetical protein
MGKFSWVFHQVYSGCYLRRVRETYIWRPMVSPDTLAHAQHKHGKRTLPLILALHRIVTMNRRVMEVLETGVHYALALLGVLLVLLASEEARHWIAEAAATICVVGGFIAAPVLTITAWIGMVTPKMLPLHHLSTFLFLVAIIWLAVAFIGAHLHHAHHHPTRN